MVKNLDVSDLALIELARTGKTDAPAGVIDKLASLKYIRLNSKGVPTLTTSGKTRAARLAGAEQTLRGMAAQAGGGFPLKTTAAGSLRS